MLCLVVISIMAAVNLYYLCGLYNSIKAQTLQTVNECIRRADIREILTRIDSVSYGNDDSFIRLTLMVEGKKTDGGGYEYPNLLDSFGRTMSEYFHIIEKSDSLMPVRDYKMLDKLFMNELNEAGLSPDTVSVRSADVDLIGKGDMWTVDFSIGDTPMYTVYFSPLSGYILSQMAGIVVTSAMILVLMGLLVSYLLRWVRKLRTIEQMKDDFTHNMTHELKTPVAVAYSAADSMLRYYNQRDEVRNRQLLKVIMQRLSFLSGMIENILSMSMERFKSMQLDIETVDVKPLIEELVGMIELKAAKDVKIVVDIPDSLTVRADPLHFGNVISNLMDNAVKYSGDSVEIMVKADTNSISISDTGIGIAAEHLPYIFDKFYRVPSGDRYEAGGYGLGLYYVRQIIGLMGWSIDVDSKLGAGSVFTIRFSNNE